MSRIFNGSSDYLITTNPVDFYIDGIGYGRNMNQPPSEVTYRYWGDIKVYISDQEW